MKEWISEDTWRYNLLTYDLLQAIHVCKVSNTDFIQLRFFESYASVEFTLETLNENMF